jgi:molecular chaperone GrpE
MTKGVELIHEKTKKYFSSKSLEVVDVKAGDAFDADCWKQLKFLHCKR